MKWFDYERIAFIISLQKIEIRNVESKDYDGKSFPKIEDLVDYVAELCKGCIIAKSV